MSVFKCNNLFSESWPGSVLIKRLGHPMKRLRLSQTAHGFKHKVRTEASISCSLLLKDCDKKVHLRKFHEGDLVLKKMSHAVKDNQGK